MHFVIFAFVIFCVVGWGEGSRWTKMSVFTASPYPEMSLSLCYVLCGLCLHTGRYFCGLNAIIPIFMSGLWLVLVTVMFWCFYVPLKPLCRHLFFKCFNILWCTVMLFWSCNVMLYLCLFPHFSHPSLSSLWLYAVLCDAFPVPSHPEITLYLLRTSYIFPLTMLQYPMLCCACPVLPFDNQLHPSVSRSIFMSLLSLHVQLCLLA